ncbi:MAG: hypothetical protein MR394_07515 [Coprococcus comes]|nr:hypothetical protein [Coprococcus comes]
MPEEKQRKKRIRVEKLDEWIETLKSIERVNRDSEYFRQNAIPYLEQYVDSLKEAGLKTVVLEEKEMRPEAATSIRRTENNSNKL